jgi:hypothetical protein
MKVKQDVRCLTFVCTAVIFATMWATLAAQSSAGWVKAGDRPADYEMGLDSTIAFTGNSSGYIRNAKPNPQGFGTYMQVFDATEYRGKRLRLSAYVRSENVKNWAGLWMRVDRDKKPVAFDNMQNRPITASGEWAQHSIVLDVDQQATVVAFGILLAGEGAVWIDDVQFDIVGTDVPVTDQTVGRVPATPRNLDFESGPQRK